MKAIDKMTFSEIKNTLLLAFVFAMRLLGLFMIVPVLALYADTLPGATPALLGLAAGIYGFTQALCQLPFGILSDYIGRKPVILGGLILFAIGSLIAAFCQSIEGIIIGRAIQGAGAIGSPILALTADITREEVRTRAMAIIGISIGFTFTLALLIGPILDAKIGLAGLFSLTALFALLGMGLISLVSAPLMIKPLHFSIKNVFSTIAKLLRDLWKLNSAIFVLHALLMASFQVLPLQIKNILHLTGAQVWQFYLPILMVSLIIIAPLLRMADKPSWQTKLMFSSMVLLGLGILGLMMGQMPRLLILSVILFFVGFNYLEASLPSLVSKTAPKESKGTALGVYSCAQFLGMFFGGTVGGYALQTFGNKGIAITCGILAIIGLFTLRGSNHGKGHQQSHFNRELRSRS